MVLSSQLRRSNNCLDTIKAVLNILPEAAFILDLRLRVEWLNPSALTWAEGSSEPVGRFLGEFFRDKRAFEEFKELLLKSRELKDFKTTFAPPGGEERLVAIRALCLSERVVLVVRDLSVPDIDCQRLAQLEKLATMGLLAMAMVHDLNTPLGIILGYVQMLEEDLAKDPEAQKMLQVIETQLRHCRELTHRLLSLARPHEESFQETDLNQVVEETLELMKESFRARGIRLISRLAKNLQKIWGSPERLREALINLLTNAQEAIGKGGEIILTTENQENQVTLAVADTGSGIPEDKKGYLFRPFFSCKEGGTGLGLFIVDSILREHGATIEVQSPIRDPHWGPAGQGTVFIIRFPAKASVRMEQKHS